MPSVQYCASLGALQGHCGLPSVFSALKTLNTARCIARCRTPLRIQLIPGAAGAGAPHPHECNYAFGVCTPRSQRTWRLSREHWILLLLGCLLKVLQTCQHCLEASDKLLLLPGWLLKILQSCQHCLHHDTISQKWLSHDSSKLISRPFRNNYVWDVLRLWPQVSVARQSTFACNRIVWIYKSVSGYPGTYLSTPSESECSPAHTGAHCLNI